MWLLRGSQAISAEAAARTGPDGRSVAQVIGHIAEWDRFAILAAGEMLAGVAHPRIIDNGGYIEPDGSERAFESVTEFNAHQAARHATWPWEDIRDLAMRSATALRALFAHPALLTPELLEQTSSYTFTLGDVLTLTTPVGWYCGLSRSSTRRSSTSTRSAGGMAADDSHPDLVHRPVTPAAGYHAR